MLDWRWQKERSESPALRDLSSRTQRTEGTCNSGRQVPWLRKAPLGNHSEVRRLQAQTPGKQIRTGGGRVRAALRGCGTSLLRV